MCRRNLLMFQERTAAPQITLNLLAPGIIWVQWSVCILGQGSFLTINRVINLLFTESVYKLSDGDSLDITSHFFLVIISWKVRPFTLHLHKAGFLDDFFFPWITSATSYLCLGDTMHLMGLTACRTDGSSPSLPRSLLGSCCSKLPEVFQHPYWAIYVIIMPSTSCLSAYLSWHLQEMQEHY